MTRGFAPAPPACPHGYNPRTCYVCKAEAVRDWARATMVKPVVSKFGPAHSSPARPIMTEAERRAHIAEIIAPGSTDRALAIVALRRIVDRAVSDELCSHATADILRIALKALNQLEE
jgi:hypothetical protein